VANRRSEAFLRPSVLDRLVGDSAVDRSRSLTRSVEALKQSLLRDLDWLLNTRRIAFPAGDDFPELQRSLYHFGLRDISSMSSDSPAIRTTLAREVEDLLRLFEPRLSGIRVSVPEGSKDRHRQVRFIIEAVLDVEPEPEPVTFDTVLEVASGEFSVKRG
jgi:type VI secretion system protein ImpF